MGEADGQEAARRGAFAGRVVMDVRMPVMDGVEATALGRRAIRPGILMLTTFDADEHAVEAIRAGPAAPCSRTCHPDFVRAIRIIASGEALIASVTKRLLERRGASKGIASCDRDARSGRLTSHRRSPCTSWRGTSRPASRTSGSSSRERTAVVMAYGFVRLSRGGRDHRCR